MILGRITGKASTTKFSFEVSGEAKKFQYVQVHHKEHEYVLCQIIELVTDYEKTTAYCNIIGYKDQNNIMQIRTPFEINMEVLSAENSMIESILANNSKNAAFIGTLEGRDIKVNLDLQQLLTKHIAVLAKSGSGKSYAVSVLIEEILEKNLPIVVIDPHGEYYSLKFPKDENSKGYFDQIVEYGDTKFNRNFKELKISEKLSPYELLHVLPSRLTSNQEALLYSVIKDMNELSLTELIDELNMVDNPTKFNVLSVVDYLKSLDLFSPIAVKPEELVRPGKCSIINLKGISTESQQIIVYKLLSDLFKARKNNQISPFFLVIEEAHNFVPEKTFGESKSTNILIDIASEGRKFGLGLCVVSQRPARVQKSVLSQCSTQMILKITNPNDLKAIIISSEGVNSDSENEIVNLPVGTCMLTGITEMPLFVKIRERNTRHGGEAVQLFEEKDFVVETKSYESQLPIIKSKISYQDFKLINGDNVSTKLIPAIMFKCKRSDQEFNFLVELVHGKVIPDLNSEEKIDIVDLNSFSKEALVILENSLHLVSFDLSAMVSKVNYPLNQVETILDELIEKNILEKNENFFNIKTNLRIISHPLDFSSYEQVEYSEISFDEKVDSKFNPPDIEKKLNAFIDVIERKECFIVNYFKTSNMS
tara:strand:- start:24 stop:1973 length:1950 start_codon:yes stop_codon:yes gene_type:complete